MQNNPRTPSRILIDMDGVLFNFCKRYAELYTAQHPDDPKTEADIDQSWNVADTTKYGDKLWKTPGFFAGMDPYPGAKEFFCWLYANYDVIVASAAPHHMLGEKTKLLQDLCPTFNDWDVMYGNRKDCITADYIIDDAPHNCAANGQRTILFAHPYNSNVTGYAARVNGFDELADWIRCHCVSRDGALPLPLDGPANAAAPVPAGSSIPASITAKIEKELAFQRQQAREYKTGIFADPIIYARYDQASKILEWVLKLLK